MKYDKEISAMYKISRACNKLDYEETKRVLETMQSMLLHRKDPRNHPAPSVSESGKDGK